MREINADLQEPIAIDAAQVEANGIRTLTGKHLILFTDINGRDDIAELTTVFDAAVEKWCQYFDVDLALTKSWQLRAMIIGDRERFVRAELVPNDLPDFLAGFQRGHEMWVYLQRGKYYTRHLLLHEGTHSFMQWFLGGTGAPWYTEGMAELLGVHQWNSGNLELNYHLQDRSEAEYWGRIKVIKEDCAVGKPMSIDDVLELPPKVFREVRYYAWSWAACEFFSKHPVASKSFHKLQGIASYSPSKFNRTFLDWIKPYREVLDRDWKLFVEEIDFGYDIERGIMRPAKAAESGNEVFLIDCGSSWQATSIAVAPGDRYELAAAGRFVVESENGIPLPCEAGGVTIDYYRGCPLGQLMIGVLGTDGDLAGLWQPQAVGLKRQVKFDKQGSICLRINESPARLDNNEGQLRVTIKRIR